MWKYSFDTVNHQPTIMPNMKQNVFIDDESSDLSSNRFGWLLDYSSFHGIHVVSSYLLRRGGAKIAIPNSIELQKSHHSSSEICWTLTIRMIAHRYYYRWLDSWGPRFMGCAGKEESISRHRCHIFGAIFRCYVLLLFKNLFFSMFSTWRSDMMSRKQVWECFLWCSKIYSCSVLIQSYYHSNILIILQWQRELEAVVSLKEQWQILLSAKCKMITGVLHWQCVH